MRRAVRFVFRLWPVWVGTTNMVLLHEFIFNSQYVNGATNWTLSFLAGLLIILIEAAIVSVVHEALNYAQESDRWPWEREG